MGTATGCSNKKKTPAADNYDTSNPDDDTGGFTRVLTRSPPTQIGTDTTDAPLRYTTILRSTMVQYTDDHQDPHDFVLMPILQP